MRGFRNLPGAAAAVGAFVLTVLLGLGGASASAFWQQSATAAMTVTANGTWAPPTITLACPAAYDKKNPSVLVTVSQTAATLTYAAQNANGSLGTSYTSAIAAPAVTATVVLDPGVFAGRTQGQVVVVRVTASYGGQTPVSATIGYTVGPGSSGITC